MRVPPAALSIVLLLLSGCTASDENPALDASDPDDPGTAGPDDPAPSGDRGAPGNASEEPFEPLVFEGTVSGAADCLLKDPMTPETIELPAEASGRTHRLELMATAIGPRVGATCLLFSDGTFHNGEEAMKGVVPDDVEWVKVLTIANVDLEYRLTIE